MRPIVRTCRAMLPWLTGALFVVELDNIIDMAPYTSGILMACAVVWGIVILTWRTGASTDGDDSGHHKIL